MDLRYYPVAVVDVQLFEVEGFDAVLVGPGMQGLLEYLTCLVDLQLGRTHLFHHRQADVAHREDVCRGQVGEHVLEHVALGMGEGVVVVVQILRHRDLEWRPVIAVGIEEEFPRPRILERHELVDVGLAVDDALVGSTHRRQRGGMGGRGKQVVHGVHWQASQSGSSREHACPLGMGAERERLAGSAVVFSTLVAPSVRR